MHIPLFMNISASANFDLHRFCDASGRAYAAVVYIKSLNPVNVILVAAKRELSPPVQ